MHPEDTALRLASGSRHSEKDWLDFVLALLPRDPDLELVNKSFVRHLRGITAQTTDPDPIDDDHYQYFVDMSDDEIDPIMVALFHSFAKAFKAIGTWPGDETDDTFIGFMDALLYMVACGDIMFDDNLVANFHAPSGPPPSADMEQRMAERIEASHDRLEDALVAACR